MISLLNKHLFKEVKSVLQLALTTMQVTLFPPLRITVDSGDLAAGYPPAAPERQKITMATR